MTITAPILIDANLLVLLVVGTLDPSLVARHKNCSAFMPEDFVLLVETLGPEPRFLVLPNIATEASNLLRQTRDPHRSELSRLLGRFVQTQREIYVESRVAVGHPLYARLGLADGACLSVDDSETHLLTVDFDLYMGFLAAGRPVTNFRHLIDARS